MMRKGNPKAIQVGGPLGRLLPYSEAAESALGSPQEGAEVAILNEDTCLVALMHDQIASELAVSATLCPKCRMALEAVQGMLRRIMEGTAPSDALDTLRKATEQLAGLCGCASSQRAAQALLAALEGFGGEFALHTVNRHCPARVCERLIPAPCHLACPAGIDIPSYLAFIAQGRYGEALDTIREDNPFAWVCGLICPHPCEKACVRAHLDEAVNIRYLKAFVAEWVTERGRYPHLPPQPPNGHRVAVVGSGPAGLSAAHYLALKGYRVTIFEALPVAGGLLMVGIPEYRLPRQIVQLEVEAIQAMGVEIRTGVRVGKDVSFEALRREGFEAFFLGIGAHRGYRLGIEGEESFPQVVDAISFLRQVNLGNREKPAERVVVVGGGNSAMDAARTCIRLGCREVHVAYRRTREQMPANPQEVEEAIEEGVQFHFLAVPIRVGGTSGRVEHLECLQAELGKPDASGRRRPVPVADSNFQIAAGAIIAAIGQEPDYREFTEALPFAVTPRNLIETEPFGTRTTAADIFAGGDVVTGPATVVEAIAAGKQAALDIDHYLSGSREPAPIFRVHKRHRVAFASLPAAEKIASRRIPVPLAPVEARTRSFEPVELRYTEAEAQREARRCLRCDVCIRCGRCEATCRDLMQIEALAFSPISNSERILTDYARPAERCITCGACALACPTGAMQLVESETGRELHLCGTVLNHLEPLRCADCGHPIAPERYLDYVKTHSDAVTGKHIDRSLCPGCARKSRAEAFVKQ